MFLVTLYGVACGAAPVDVGGGDPGGGAAGGASPACPGALLECPDGCVEPRFDPANCGACGTACADGQVCSAGSCGLACAGGTTKCEVASEASPNDPPASVCIDTQVDTNHCGACGKACTADQVCSNGACADDCNGGTTECDGMKGAVCVNVASDAAHCGDCDKPCNGGQACVDGGCLTVCVGGTTLCQDAKMVDVCVNTAVDVGHCGNCNTPCAAEEVCSGGMCGLSCVGGTIKCGSACTNTAVDAAHCGACNKPCATGEICASGMCKLGCGIGLTQCGNACFNTAIDPAHCGVCSKACSVGEVCSAGTCGLTCGAGLTQCGNACTNTALDPQNCGICGNSCGGGKVCSNGSCKSVAPTVVQVASGYLHTCTLFSDGTVKCWGDNSSGQLGYGHTQDRGSGPNQMGELLPAIALGTGKTAKAIAAGDYHSCALLNDDSIKCWGRNTNGQLGLGDILARGDGAKEMGDLLPAILLGTGKTAKVIAAGGAYNCAILNDDTVKCWGYNASGRLGLGDATQRGSAASHMGNFLPTVALGTDKTAKGIALGDDHTCAILNDATVKCWGSNNYGELGLGDTLSRGDNANEMGDLLPAISLGVGKTTKAIAACGPSHSCAILNDDTVKCWGYNVQGQLGLGDALARGDNANEMGGNLPAVSLATGKTAKAISGGDSHTCALLNDATVKCWGYNAGGKLGLGDTTNRGSNPNHMGNLLPAVMLGTGKTALAVAAGDGHTCSVLSDLSVKCWGYNGSGRLGLGDLVNRGDDGNEMGEFLPAVLLLGL